MVFAVSVSDLRCGCIVLLWLTSKADDVGDGDADAKQRCLPELHDVPYDTPPPSNQPSATAAGSAGPLMRTSHHELMDEPIYANAAAHPPVIGTVSVLHNDFLPPVMPFSVLSTVVMCESGFVINCPCQRSYNLHCSHFDFFATGCPSGVSVITVCSIPKMSLAFLRGLSL